MPKLINFKPGSVVFKCDGWECVEMHASTCSHCQHVTEFPSLRKMTDYIDFCRVCMEEVCIDRPGPNGTVIPGCAGRPCKTWLKQADIEEAVYNRQFYGNLREF